MYSTIAGAIPKEVRSAMLSYSAPNALCVLVSRATRPSRPSSTIAMKIATAACSKCWPMAAVMA